jgi:hypothetical protein
VFFSRHPKHKVAHISPRFLKLSSGIFSGMQTLPFPDYWEWTPKTYRRTKNFFINNCVFRAISFVVITNVYIVEFLAHHRQPAQCLLTCRKIAVCSGWDKDDIQPAARKIEGYQNKILYSYKKDMSKFKEVNQKTCYQYQVMIIF